MKQGVSQKSKKTWDTPLFSNIQKNILLIQVTAFA